MGGVNISRSAQFDLLPAHAILPQIPTKRASGAQELRLDIARVYVVLRGCGTGCGADGRAKLQGLTMEYIPTDKQAEAIRLALMGDKPLVWTGGIRGGKTVGSALAIIEKMKNFSGHYLIASYSLTQVERVLLPVFIAVLDSEGVEYTVSRRLPMTINIPEWDCVVWTASGSDSASYKSVQGVTLQGALLDEAVLMPQGFVMQVVGRLSEDSPMLILTANKEGPNHWMKRHWVDTGVTHVLDTGTEDNPHISEDTLAWYDSLLVGGYKDTMLGNKWSDGVGPVVGDVKPLPKILRGTTSNWVAYKVIDPSGTNKVVSLQSGESGAAALIDLDFEGEGLPDPTTHRHAKDLTDLFLAPQAQLQKIWVEAAKYLSGRTWVGCHDDILYEVEGLFWVSQNRLGDMTDWQKFILSSVYYSFGGHTPIEVELT